ncbi:endochitinase 2-like [Phragmites australis]|uniref:endochitinase 2-like n=1 Tax=Phragmites australis TaxID=29695 RepID=UPI002D79A3EB|nr:endochitinase 2-like [Phragmites australis]
MATSKKEPLNPSRDRATRMSPNLRPSSSESSGYGYGTRRARSVPSSPDRKFGSSSPSVAASGSPDVNRPSLSSAGRSVSSRTGSSIHGGRTQPFPGAASKPTLVRAKSDKVGTTSQRSLALALPPSNSFKDMAKTASKASPSTLLRSRLSPRPDSCKAAASPKPSTQKVASPGAARGGRVQTVSNARSPGAIAKNRLDAAKAATASSKAKSVSQKVMGASATRKENEEDPLMQFKETESISTPSIEENLHGQLPDPVDLKSMDVAVRDQHEPSSNQPEQQVKNEEDFKGHFSGEKDDAGGNKLHNGGQDANGGVKTFDESGFVEKEEANGSVDKAVHLPNMTEVAQMWRKDDPKGNDVIEEAKSKLLEERKSRVKALVGVFETVMSFKE